MKRRCAGCAILWNGIAKSATTGILWMRWRWNFIRRKFMPSRPKATSRNFLAEPLLWILRTASTPISVISARARVWTGNSLRCDTNWRTAISSRSWRSKIIRRAGTGLGLLKLHARAIRSNSGWTRMSDWRRSNLARSSWRSRFVGTSWMWKKC